jgi:hypothetical protein
LVSPVPRGFPGPGKPGPNRPGSTYRAVWLPTRGGSPALPRLFPGRPIHDSRGRDLVPRLALAIGEAALLPPPAILPPVATGQELGLDESIYIYRISRPQDLLRRRPDESSDRIVFLVQDLLGFLVVGSISCPRFALSCFSPSPLFFSPTPTTTGRRCHVCYC